MNFHELMLWNWREGPSPSPPETNWNTWTNDHRATLPIALECISAKSLYEIGCGAGPNLRLIREKMPDVALGGCDIRQEYIDWCRKQALHIDLETLPCEVSDDWDVTLSCYTMAYIDKALAMEQLRIIQTPYLILMEPHGDDEIFGHVTKEGRSTTPRYYHDWLGMLRQTGWQILYRWPISPVSDLRTLTVAQRG